jgi:hypothetical protein
MKERIFQDSIIQDCVVAALYSRRAGQLPRSGEAFILVSHRASCLTGDHAGRHTLRRAWRQAADRSVRSISEDM